MSVRGRTDEGSMLLNSPDRPGVRRTVAKYYRWLHESSLAKNASWLLLGQGVSFLTQAAYFVILARLLGTTQYGIYVAAAALAAIVAQYCSLGSGFVFMQHVSHDPGKFAVYWGNILASTLGLGSLLSALLYFGGPRLVGSASSMLFLTIAVGDCVCQQLTNASSQVFQAFDKMRLTVILNTSISLARLLAAGIMLAAVRHAAAEQWAFAAMVVSVLATLGAVITITLKFGTPRFSAELLVSRAHDGLVYSVSGSTTTVYNDIDKVLLGHFGMNAATAIYAVAYKIINISNIPMTSVYTAAFPKFFRLGAEGMRRTVPFAQKLVKKTSILGIASAAAIFVISPLVPHIIGSNYAQSASALRWLCLIPFFRSFHLSAGDAIAGAGKQRFRLYSQLLAAGLNFGLNMYLIPHYSWRGAAWASLLTDGSLGAMNWMVAFYLLKRELPQDIAVCSAKA
jgi:O-antigen/teichoic acid export membrane protein